MKIGERIVTFDNPKVIFLGVNQFIIKSDESSLFQSYDKIIVVKTKKVTILDETYWDYSRTTSRYRNKFLNEGINETRKKIKTAEYYLANLNL